MCVSAGESWSGNVIVCATVELVSSVRTALSIKGSLRKPAMLLNEEYKDGLSYVAIQFSLTTVHLFVCKRKLVACLIICKYPQV